MSVLTYQFFTCPILPNCVIFLVFTKRRRVALNLEVESETTRQHNDLGDFRMPDDEDMENVIFDEEGSHQIAFGTSEAPFPSGNAVTDDEDEELDTVQLFASMKSLKTNMYPHMGTAGEIASLHTGKVILMMKEETDENEITTRRIYPARGAMNIAGGQAYMPTFLYNLLGKQRKNEFNLTAFPMMLTRALMSTVGGFDKDQKKLIEKLITTFVPIAEIAEYAHTEIATSCPSNLRFEYFFCTTFQDEACDFDFPNIPYRSITTKFNHKEFTKSWKDSIIDNYYPLRDLMLSIGRSLKLKEDPIKLSKLSPELKTRLVFCAEQLLTITEIGKFSGRITKNILDCQRRREGELGLVIPDSFMTDLSEHEKQLAMTTWGLDPKLLDLPTYTRMTQATSEAGLRRAPSHIQQLGGQMRNRLISPHSYYRYTGIIQRRLYEATHVASTTLVVQQVGLFHEPDYDALSKLSLDDVGELFRYLAKCIWDSFDCEWWFLILDHASKKKVEGNFRHPILKRLKDFPRTNDSFLRWDQHGGNRSLFTPTEAWRNEQIEIDTPGLFILCTGFEYLLFSLLFLTLFFCRKTY
jgi:hypothetical protein